MPASPPPPVPRTHDGLAPRSSAHWRISSGSTVVCEEALEPPRLRPPPPFPPERDLPLDEPDDERPDDRVLAMSDLPLNKLKTKGMPAASATWSARWPIAAPLHSRLQRRSAAAGQAHISRTHARGGRERAFLPRVAKPHTPHDSATTSWSDRRRTHARKTPSSASQA